jgi:hemolysin-activating ACP:hemolysin acyltransferase
LAFQGLQRKSELVATETEADETVFRQLKPSMEALGLVVAFVAREPPFSEHRAGSLVRAVKHQLSSRNHVCLLRGETLLGYCGWLPVTTSDAEKWLRNETQLRPAALEAADAFALTIVSVVSGEHLRPIIRACRRLHPNQRVFFKREGADGQSRKATVVSK